MAISRWILALVACAAVSISTTPAHGQQAHNCEWLLRYGIYDTEDYGFERYTIGSLKSLLKESKAETLSDFKKEVTSLGFTIPDFIEGFLFGRDDDKRTFIERKKSFLLSTTSDLLQDEKFRASIRRINPDLMQAVMKCLDNPPKDRVIGWVRPSRDDRTFTLTLKYNPSGDHPAEIQSVTFKSSTRDNFPLDESQLELIKPGKKVPISGVAVVFQREKVTEGLTVAINTSEGPFHVEIPPVDPNEAIDRLTRRVAEVEKKLDSFVSSDVIRAKGLHIVSKDGRVRARLGVGATGDPNSVQLELLDQEGHVQLSARVGANQYFDGPAKTIKVEPNQPRIDLWISGMNATRFLSPNARQPGTLDLESQESVRPH